MTTEPLITCTDLAIRFGNEVVLEDLSFQIPKDKHTVLKGESGSGKSTLLKLFLGFLEPDKGSVQYDNGRSARAMRKETAWLPQDLDLGSGTVEEIIQKPFRFTENQSKRPDRATYTLLLAEFGLTEDNLDKQFRDLSTGQRQRVGLALCHLLDKPILLLDEPTSALDKASKQRARNILLGHTNKTVISTSHDTFWVKQADNIIKLS